LNKLVFTLLLMSLVSACSTLPKSVKPYENAESSGSQPVFVVSHGWHTGIVFPRKAILNHVPSLSDRFPTGEYLEFGWGDKGFYEAKEITTSLTIRAIFWPTESVVHVVSVPESPYLSFPNSEIRAMCLSQYAMDSLGKFLSQSFRKDKTSNLFFTKKGIYGDSQFYVGEGSFYLFNNCNKWTAKALESAGFNIDPTFKLTASSVISFMDTNENHTSPCSRTKYPAISN